MIRLLYNFFHKYVQRFLDFGNWIFLFQIGNRFENNYNKIKIL